jgi:phage terminase large subunit-like protein
MADWRRPKGMMLSKRRAQAPGKFKQKAAERAVNFIQELPQIKGEWAGRKLVLEPWQREVVEDVFGTLNPDGTRQYRTVYIEIPRKNGKTTLAAAIALYLLFADREPGAEVYSAAYDRDQASIAFDIAKAMVELRPELMRRCTLQEYKKRITRPGASFYRAVEREAKGQHGFNAHGIIFDEVHTQRDPELWDVLTTSTGSRRQPMTFAITTAGFDRTSICWQLHSRARRILNGHVPQHNTFYPVIFGASRDDKMESEVDWLDESLWRQANPGLASGIVRIDELRAKAEEAQEIPEQQNTFKRLRLDLWTQAETRLIDGGQWDECKGGVEEKAIPEGAVCYGGLDLSSTQDLTSFCMVFPRGDELHAHWRFWCPQDAIIKRSRDDGVPYDYWAREGYIKATPGKAVDLDAVEAEVIGLSKRFNLTMVGHDRWQAAQMSQHLNAEDIETAGIGQGFAGISEATKEMLKMILRREFRHTGHPVMRWMVDNAVGEIDSAENVKPSKKVSTEKIDGVVAAAMAVDCYIRQEPEFVSRYEQEEMASI